MPLAGFSAAQGKLSLPLVILSGTAGSLAGALFWYWVGIRLGLKRVKGLAARHGRLLTMCPPDVDRATDWFRRHGRGAVLIGRLIPGVRTLISVPAGVKRMPFGQFLLYSTIGTGLWTAFLAAAGLLLENQYDRVADYLNPVSNVITVGLFGAYLYRVFTFDKSCTETE